MASDRNIASESKSHSQDGGNFHRQCNNRPVCLYVYEWVVDDFKFLGCIQPFFLLSPEFLIGEKCLDVLQLQLYPLNGIDHFKVRIMLKGLADKTRTGVKSYSCSTFNSFPRSKPEEVGEKEDFSENSLSFDVCEVILEFLDYGGKVIEFLNFVPSGDSKNFTWEPDNDVFDFVQRGSLKLRLKLSIGYRMHEFSAFQSFSGKRDNLSSKSCETLCNDLEKISEGPFSDLIVNVGGERFPVHKCVLLPQFKFLSKLVSELKTISSKMQGCQIAEAKNAVESVSIPGCKAELFKGILPYLYSGRLPVKHISYFDLFDFSQKYQLCELSRNLKPYEIRVQTHVQKTLRRFHWRITEFSIKSLERFVLHESPEFETSDGETWRIVLYFFGYDSIFLSLKNVSLNSQCANFHYFRLIVSKPNGTSHEERQFVHTFKSSKNPNLVSSTVFGQTEEGPKDAPRSYPSFLDPESRFSVSPDLLFDDALCVGCEITVCDGLQTREVTQVFPDEPRDFVFKSWHRNLQSLLDSGDLSDVTLIVDQTDFKVHKAILSARSPVFATMFETDMSEKLSASVKIQDISCSTMKCALRYIYTGSLDVLTMDEAPELYRTADQYQVLSMKEKCSEFILHNLDSNHACEVLILADLYGEKKMMKAAKDMVCRSTGIAFLSEYGQELLVNHPGLAQDVFDSLSAAYCSLPPQDRGEKDKNEGSILTFQGKAEFKLG